MTSHRFGGQSGGQSGSILGVTTMMLTDTAIRAAKPREKSWKLADYQGLYLLIQPNGTKHWYLKYRFEGKESRIGFGPYPSVTLAEARNKRDSTRKLIREGTNPVVAREEARRAESGNNSFEDIARAWHKSNKRWDPHHAQDVLRSLENHVFPVLGQCSVVDIKTRDLLLLLRTVEAKGLTDITLRIQQRLNHILRYAVQMGYIEYNPAQELTGAVKLPAPNHHPALELTVLPDFLTRINQYRGRPLTKLAVQIAFRLFIRSSELRYARRSEINLKKAIWTIPGVREPLAGDRFSYRGAKMKTEHVVPLARQVVRLFEELFELTGEQELVFPGDHNPMKAMSENTVNKALRTMGYDTKKEVCGHGFRTMACSALVESGLWSRDAVERQMSHQERNPVRAAYIHKARMMEELKLMMQWWANYLDANQEIYISPWEYAERK